MLSGLLLCLSIDLICRKLIETKWPFTHIKNGSNVYNELPNLAAYSHKG
jgi:hypothetical protein